MKDYNNFIKEYWGTGENKDFNGEYIQSEKDGYKYIGYNELDVEEIFDDCIEIPKNSIKEYISLNTIKNMFPIFNELDFDKDWSIKIYKYQNYIFIYKSGYYYTFIKKN